MATRRARGKWRLVLLAAIMGMVAALTVGLTPGSADASLSPTTGYYPYGPQPEGDASSCLFLAGDFGTAYPDLFTNAPVVGTGVTPNCAGAWVATADGGVFTSGSATFYGSAGGLHLNAPIVGMATTPDGHGYWLVAADGGIFSYGDAHFYGSMGGKTINAPMVGMAAAHGGAGYWLVASDGGVFTFGDARFEGSMGGTQLVAPVTAVASTPSGNGYWLAAADGGVFTFGAAGFYGSATTLGGPGGSDGGDVIANPIIGITSSPAGLGYFLLPTTPAVNPADPHDTGYALAQREWEFSPREAAYLQSVTWLQAASYLRLGQSVDPGNKSGYPAAIAALDQLASVPEMDVTPIEQADALADVAALTTFFQAKIFQQGF